jgi:hypothetical protein
VCSWFVIATFAIAGSATAQTYRVDIDPSLDTLPSAQGWTHYFTDPAPIDGLTEANYSVGGGVLVQGPTGGGNSDATNTQWYERIWQPFDFDDDVIEVDLRLVITSSTISAPPASVPSAGFAVQVSDADRQQVVLYIGSSGLFLYGGNQATSDFVAFDTTAGFADYRVRIDAYGASLRVDGEQLAYIPRNYFSLVTTANQIKIGDITTLQQGGSILERFTIGRFNPPAPEVRNFAWASETSPVDSQSLKFAAASCPTSPGAGAPRNLLAVGANVEETAAHPFTMLRLWQPTGPYSADGWANEREATQENWSVQTDVVCGEIAGLEYLDEGDVGNGFDLWTEVSCSEGKSAISGGSDISAGLDLEFARIVASQPLYDQGEPVGWSTLGRYDLPPSGGVWLQSASVVCSDVRGLTLVTSSLTDTASDKSVVAVCPAGSVVVGGGATLANDPLRGRVVGSYPTPVFGSLPTAWVVTASKDPVTSESWELQSTAICAPTADPTTTRHKLVGRWPADSGYPADELAQNDGALINGASIIPGLRNQAFSVDGDSGDWLSIPGGDFYPAGAFSVDAFFQTSTASGELAAIASLYDAGGINPVQANFSAWSIQLTPEGFGSVHSRPASSSNTVSVIGTEVLTDGLPHHIALVRNLEPSTRRLELWIDGAMVDSESLTLGVDTGAYYPSSAANPDPITVGAQQIPNVSNLQRGFDGLIDDLKFYDRALSREEIENTAGCGVPILPRVLNLDASRFGGPEEVPNSHRLCVYLDAGTYDVTLVSPVEDPLARFTAWSASNVGDWGTAYSIVGETSPSTGGGIPLAETSMQAAFDNTTTKTISFTLTAAERVYFGIEDGAVLDNQGGVSLRIAVPEPGLVTTLMSGIALLAAIARRRSRSQQREA